MNRREDTGSAPWWGKVNWMALAAPHAISVMLFLAAVHVRLTVTERLTEDLKSQVNTLLQRVDRLYERQSAEIERAIQLDIGHAAGRRADQPGGSKSTSESHV